MAKKQTQTAAYKSSVTTVASMTAMMLGASAAIAFILMVFFAAK